MELEAQQICCWNLLGLPLLSLLKICWYKNHLFQHPSTSSKKWRPSKSVAEICWDCLRWIFWKFADIKNHLFQHPSTSSKKNDVARGPGYLLLKFCWRVLISISTFLQRKFCWRVLIVILYFKFQDTISRCWNFAGGCWFQFLRFCSGNFWWRMMIVTLYFKYQDTIGRCWHFVGGFWLQFLHFCSSHYSGSCV